MKSPLNDEELVRLYVDTHQSDYFNILYERYVTKVYNRCMSFFKDHETAQDLTQDIFVRVFTRLDNFQQRAAFSTWLYSISYNYCMDHIRTGKRLNTLPLESEFADEVADNDDSSTLHARLHQLSQFVDDLPQFEQNLLKLKYEQGKNVQEISEELKLSESAVKMRLKRTRDKVRELHTRRARV